MRGASRAPQHVQHTLGGGIRALVAAIDDDVRLGINLMTGIHQTLQDLGPVAVGEQRAVVAAGHPAQQNRQGTAQPDGDGFLADHRAGFRVHERATTECEHQRIA